MVLSFGAWLFILGALAAANLIIANDVSQQGIGFDSVQNEVTLCFPSGKTTALPRQSKTALARELIQIISSSIQLALRSFSEEWASSIKSPQ